MDAATKRVLRQQAEAVIEKLERNNMKGYYAASKAEAVEKVAELLHEGDTVAVGGSMSLEEAGVMALLRSGRYQFLDRYAPGLTREETEEIYRRSFFADAYLCSSNAVTMNGELYNVDGNSNRVAAICYGPRSVIMVVGCNKIVRDIPAAVIRVKRRSAPANVARLRCDTPCAKTGACAGIQREGMTDGCGVDGRICCNYLVSARQRVPGRIKVILVGEELGY